MQYDLKELAQDQIVTMVWHGEPTRVLVRGEGEKREVKKGDELEVSVKQARELLKYSPDWTLSGDKPVDQPYRAAQKAAVEAKAPKAKKAEKKAAPALTKEAVEAAKTKEDVLALCKAHKIKVNDNASVDELKAVLLDELKEKKPAKK